jgi:hypothetical protein
LVSTKRTKRKKQGGKEEEVMTFTKLVRDKARTLSPHFSLAQNSIKKS